MEVTIRAARAEDSGQLWRLCVRGGGVGRALHEHVVEWCRERPVRFLEWQTSESAVAFYERLGYRPDRAGDFAKHPFFEHDFTFTAGHMRR